MDGVDLFEGQATPEYIDALHAAGLSFNVWTVDRPERARTLIEWDVDSITSNRAYAIQQEVKR